MYLRLEELRLAKGFTKKDFAKKLEVTEQAYSNYSKGKRNLQVEHILKLKQLFNMSTDWLLFGIGDMFIDDPININYKEEIIKNLDVLEDKQIKYIYHYTEAEKIK